MRFTLHRKAMFTLLSIVYMLVFLHGVVMTVFAKDLMRDMDLNPDGMGMLGSSYLYAYAGMMLFSGMLAAWAGPRRTLAALFMVSGAGGLLFALSASLSGAMLGRALCGMGLAATMTSSFTLFGRWYAPSSYSRVCAIFFAVGGMGTLIGIAVLPAINEIWGWRTIFGSIAVITLVYGMLLFLVVRDWPPADIDVFQGQAGVMRGEAGLGILWGSIKQVARRRDFWRLAGWFVSLQGIYFTFVGLWAIPYLKDVYNIPASEAGLMVSTVAVGFIVGSPLIAWINDNVIHSCRITVGLSGLLSLTLLVIMVAFIDTLNTRTLYILMICFGMTVNAPNACAYAAARNLFGTRMAGITGGVFGCSAFLGGAIGQVVCGALLNYAQNLHWTPAAAYSLAFAPLLVHGAVAAFLGFTLSTDSDGAVRA